jgi:hypothetical protein
MPYGKGVVLFLRLSANGSLLAKHRIEGAQRMSTISGEGDGKTQKRIELKFSWIPGPFSICRLPNDSPLPEWAWRGPFTSVTRTADELSIVCLAENLPKGVGSRNHWICFKLEGPFSFSEVGILASVISPLAENGVPIFAVSTYDTDYVLVSEEHAGVMLQALRDAGHQFLP